jgi:hypothetical protein
MQFVGCMDKNRISKQLDEKDYDVKIQYYFAEQINKPSEENSILLVCAASAVFLKPIHNPLWFP